MPVYSAEEASWISRANAVVTGRRHLSDEDLNEVLTGEDPSLKLRSVADWLLRTGKTMAQREQKQNEAAANEKVSRRELVLALMGYSSLAEHNQLMVYTMALMKVLEKKGICSKQEIRDQISEFAKAHEEAEASKKEFEEAAAETPIAGDVEIPAEEPHH